MLKKLSIVIFVLFVFLVATQEGMSRSRRPSTRRINKNARHIVRRIVKQVKQSVRKGRGRIISRKVREAIREWKNKEEMINLDLSMEFLGSYGYTIADENGLTYFIDGEQPYTDGKIIYLEEYWGEYPFYFSGSDVGVKLTITHKGKKPKSGFDIEYTAYNLNIDGSDGASIMGPETRNISIANGKPVITEIIFRLPLGAKYLNRFIVSIYTEGTLLMTKEGIFCPPEELK